MGTLSKRSGSIRETFVASVFYKNKKNHSFRWDFSLFSAQVGGLWCHCDALHDGSVPWGLGIDETSSVGDKLTNFNTYSIQRIRQRHYAVSYTLNDDDIYIYTHRLYFI